MPVLETKTLTNSGNIVKKLRQREIFNVISSTPENNLQQSTREGNSLKCCNSSDKRENKPPKTTIKNKKISLPNLELQSPMKRSNSRGVTAARLDAPVSSSIWSISTPGSENTKSRRKRISLPHLAIERPKSRRRPKSDFSGFTSSRLDAKKTRVYRKKILSLSLDCAKPPKRSTSVNSLYECFGCPFTSTSEGREVRKGPRCQSNTSSSVQNISKRSPEPLFSFNSPSLESPTKLLDLSQERTLIDKSGYSEVLKQNRIERSTSASSLDLCYSPMKIPMGREALKRSNRQRKSCMREDFVYYKDWSEASSVTSELAGADCFKSGLEEKINIQKRSTYQRKSSLSSPAARGRKKHQRVVIPGPDLNDDNAVCTPSERPCTPVRVNKVPMVPHNTPVCSLLPPPHSEPSFSQLSSLTSASGLSQEDTPRPIKRVPIVPHNTPVCSLLPPPHSESSFSQLSSLTSASGLSQEDTPRPIKRGPGRPRKWPLPVAVLEENSSTASCQSSCGEPRAQRGRPSGAKRQRGRRSRWSWDFDDLPPQEPQISEYEMERQRNIEENMKMLRQLFIENGLQFEDKSSDAETHSKARKSYKSKTPPPPRPKSTRLGSKRPVYDESLDFLTIPNELSEN